MRLLAAEVASDRPGWTSFRPGSLVSRLASLLVNLEVSWQISGPLSGPLLQPTRLTALDLVEAPRPDARQESIQRNARPSIRHLNGTDSSSQRRYSGVVSLC